MSETDQAQGQPDAEEMKAQQASDMQDKAKEAEEKHDRAREKMKELEEQDEPPTNLADWPEDEAKYVTYGGPEGDHSYEEGPEKKLGPSSLERRPDGSVLIAGEEVDNPDDYRGDPVPGGPTDPDTPELHGERKKREKLEALGQLPDEYKKDPGASESEGERSESEEREQ
jgi:hypothetical protein